MALLDPAHEFRGRKPAVTHKGTFNGNPLSVAAAIACTTLPGLARYMTPSWIMGVGWLVPSVIDHTQASLKSSTLLRLISSSGL